MKQESRSVWFVDYTKYGVVLLEFTDFDISCQSGSSLRVQNMTRNEEYLCNLHKPLHKIRFHNSQILLEFNQVAPTNSIYEGFVAFYTVHTLQGEVIEYCK